MELQIFTSFQFCILLVWSANGDAPFQGKFQVNLLNDDTYRWNCVTSSYGLIGRAKRAPHWGVQSRFRVIYYICRYVCRGPKKRRRNYVGQTRACSKSVLGGKILPVTPILLYAIAALAWTEEKRSLRNEKLKANRAS